jgi:UDP-2,3-diacylglucosamine pyrophosphatase LpxH
MSRKQPDPARLAEFLAQPRTVEEIAAELKRPGLSPVDVWQLSLPDRVHLFEQKNIADNSVFRVSREPDPPVIQRRIWSYWIARELGQPYIWIQFPPTLKVPRVKIVPLSDIHYGAKAHDLEKFKRYIAWIARNDEVYAFLNGDIIENAIDGSVGGAAYESIMTPSEQIWGDPTDPDKEGIIELLRPIAHKLVWAQPGNHEWRTWKKTNIDPLRIVCRELDIPYFDEPIYADVLAFGHRFTFHCQHGTSGSATKGGKMNAANRPAEYQEAVDFVIMGHVHDSMANPVTRIVRKRDFDDQGNLVGFRLEERSQYVIICPSFYRYWKTYGHRAGYAPGSTGAVACTLNRDGTYRVSK